MDADIKNQIELFTLLNGLPKIDLHCHLNGNIRKKTLLDNLSEKDIKSIEPLYKQMNYSNALKFYDISSKIFSKLSLVKQIINEIIDDWKRHNCIYLEIRTFLKSYDNEFNKEEFLIAILEEIEKQNNLNNNKIIVRLIICLDRSKEINDYLEVYNIYKNLSQQNLKKIIVGIDYCGNELEEKHKYEDVIPIFEKFKNEGLKITLQMAQCKKYQKFPFDKFIPDRISHCYFLNDNDLNEIISRNIHIEVCPIISMRISGVIDFKKIPMNRFYKKEVENINSKEKFIYKNISINTDSSMLVLSDLSQEYYEVGVNFNLNIKNLKEIVLNTIDNIFDDNVKEELKEKLNKYYY